MPQVISSYSQLARLRGQPSLGLTSYGGVPDARFVSDAAMTSGSAVLTSATAAFTTADVGKTIRVTNAGGALTKLATTIASRQSATQVTLAATAAATVSATGAVWGTDAGPALLAALTAVVTGGAVLIDGPYLIGTAVAKDFASTMGSVALLGTGGSNSRLYIAVAETDWAISVSNLGEFLVEGITFIGTPLCPVDARATLRANAVRKFSVHDCKFIGLACADALNGSIVHGVTSGMELARCRFLGCTGSGAWTNPVVRADTWIGLFVRDCDFFDYGTIDGYTHTKPGIASAFAWVAAFRPSESPADDSLSQSPVVIEDCRGDEGPFYGVYVGDAANPSYRAMHVRIRGFYTNVNSATPAPVGTGIRIRYADDVRIEESFLGYVQGTLHDAVIVENCTNVTLDRVRCRQHAGRITATTVTTLTVRDCEYELLALSAVTNFNPVANSLGGVVPVAKAGETTDLDFAAPPANGTVAVDSTNKKFGVRLGGAWYWSAALTVASAPAASHLGLPASGGSATAPDKTIFTPNLSLDVRYDGTRPWNEASKSIVAQFNTTGNQRSWQFQSHTTALQLITSGDGSATVTTLSSAHGITVSSRYQVRVAAAATGTVTFYKRDPALALALSNDASWTQISTHTISAFTFFDSTSVVEIGTTNGGTASGTAQQVKAVRVKVDGNVVYAPDFSAQPVGATTVGDGLGNTTTLSGTTSVDAD